MPVEDIYAKLKYNRYFLLFLVQKGANQAFPRVVFEN